MLQILEAFGYEVYHDAEDQDPVGMCSQYQPMLAILNFKQSLATDGMALAQAIKAQFTIPVLLITGAHPLDIQHSKAYDPAIPVLFKPFTPKQLSNSLAFLTGSK